MEWWIVWSGVAGLSALFGDWRVGLLVIAGLFGVQPFRIIEIALVEIGILASWTVCAWIAYRFDKTVAFFLAVMALLNAAFVTWHLHAVWNGSAIPAPFHAEIKSIIAEVFMVSALIKGQINGKRNRNFRGIAILHARFGVRGDKVSTRDNSRT